MTSTEFGAILLNDQIPLKYRRLIPPKLKLAYEMVAQEYLDQPFLQVPTALDNKGRLISYAVDFAIKGLIDSQEWPVEYRWQTFARPTGRYLEIILPHSTVSISQVAFWQEQPRDVEFRRNARISNHQHHLFDGDKDPDFEKASGPISLLLVHGYKQLEFAHFGIPHPFQGAGYIYQTPNLLRLLHEAAPPDIPPPERQFNPDDLMSLKEEIERWRKDNGES